MRQPNPQRKPTVRVGGRQPLRDLYACLLAARYHGPIYTLDDEAAVTAAAWGAVSVVRRHAERLEGASRGTVVSG